MITPAEYLAYKTPPHVAWIHGLKLLEHILPGIAANSFYKDPNPATSCYEDLLRELKAPKKPEGLKAIFERTLRRTSRVHETRDAMGCEIDLGDYLSGSSKPLIDYRKDLSPRSSLTVVIDMNVPSSHRTDNYMERRHKLIYSLCASCLNNNKAIRIIGAFGIKYPECKHIGGDLFLFIIKDYADPIFENIWGALRNNATTNDLLNCIMDYLVGTSADGNGNPASFVLDRYIHDQIVLVDPRFFSCLNPGNKTIRS